MAFHDSQSGRYFHDTLIRIYNLQRSRSIAATATFFVVGLITARILHKDLQPSATVVDWTLGTKGMELLALQAIPLFLNFLIYALVSYFISCTDL